MTAQKARKTYYTTYVRVIGQRLMVARKAAGGAVRPHASESETGAALVLRGKEIEVRDYYAANSTARDPWRGSQASFSPGTLVAMRRPMRRRARLEPAREIRAAPAVASCERPSRLRPEDTLLFMLDNGGTVQFMGSSMTMPVERRLATKVSMTSAAVRDPPWGYPDVLAPVRGFRGGAT